MINNGLGFGLSNAPLLSSGKSRSISAENPTGAKGGGGKAANHLGVGRKGKAYISLKQGETTELADIVGTGVIQSIWITIPEFTDKGRFVLRDLVLRMYWDGEKTPSVEAPIGDFFCNGFAKRSVVNSLPIAVNPTGGFNCFFPMPFRKHARITVENQHARDIDLFFFQINYNLFDSIPDDAAYFHAQWRRENPTKLKEDYVILDNIVGRGHYVGVYMAWAALSRYWWGEGEIKFYIDGDKEYPTICGTGTEDYFGGAWCFYEKNGNDLTEIPYSTPFLGYPQAPSYKDRDEFNFGALPGTIPAHGLYRWHLMDPINFSENLKVTIQQIGHNSRELFERSDDISSVAYWYQSEPHGKFPLLMPPEMRWPR